MKKIIISIICLATLVFTIGTYTGAESINKNRNLEEAILASNACIGGPTTAAAMAVSKGWTKLIAPIMLIGTLGYVIGNYCGIIIGNFLL